MAEYAIGNVLKLAANFQSNSSDVDPGGVTFKIKSPLGIVTTYVYGTNSELVKESTGDYYVHFQPTEEGRHVYRFVSTISYIAAAEASFDVAETQFN